MSWSTYAQGTKTQAKKQVEADQTVPDAVKQAVALVLSIMPDQQHVKMETHGHLSTLDANLTIRITSLSPGKSA